MAGGFGDVRDEPDHANKRGAEPCDRFTSASATNT